MRGLAAILTLYATQAQALSCLPADPIASFVQARDSEDVYTVVRGALTGRPDLPAPDMTDPAPEHAHYTAQFKGHRISLKGFKTPFEAQINVTELCLAVWCAQVPEQNDAVLFLRQTAEGWALEECPCGGQVFPDPTDKMIKDLTRCAKGGRCTPEFTR